MTLKVCIVGYGNSAKALLIDLGKNSEMYVYSESDIQTDHVRELNTDNITFFNVIKDKSELSNMDVVWITYPSYIIEDKLSSIETYLREVPLVILSPGQLDYSKINNINLDNYVSVLPLPYNCRTVDINTVDIKFRKTNFIVFGKSTRLKNDLLYSVLKSKNRLWGMSGNITSVNNFPINPILHTARLYESLNSKNFDINSDYSNDKFYNFNHNTIELIQAMSSEISLLQSCDDEFIIDIVKDVHKLSNLNLFLKDYVYECQDIDILDFYNNHVAYQNIGFPIDNEGKLDIKSRYFTEDLPGLKMLIDRLSKIDNSDYTVCNKVYQSLNKFMKT
jgi:hypothetical protein